MQTWFEKLKADFVLNFVQANRWKYLLDGLGKTLLITLVACLLGVVIGVVIAMVRSTYDKPPRARARPSAAGCSACWTASAACI